MKASLQDQLQNLQLDQKMFGNLPRREDIYLTAAKMEDIKTGMSDSGDLDEELEKRNGLLKQWKLLNMLRKNLNIVNKYINDNKGETLKEWAIKAKQFPANKVIEEIGDFNDSTKGISVYFLNLQNFYDEQEQAYDDMEAKTKDLDIPADIKKAFAGDRKIRADKRKVRREARKLMLKDFEKNDKGYIVIEEEKKQEAKPEEAAKIEPEKIIKSAETLGDKVENASTDKVINPEADKKVLSADAASCTKTAPPVKANDDIKKATQKKIKIAIFGTIILLTAFVFYKGMTGKEE